MIHFALNNWKGVQKWDVVFIQIPECAKPLYIPLQEEVFSAGAYPMMHYMADWVTRSFFEQIPDELLEFYPRDYLLSRVAAMDHRLYVLAESDKHELEGVDPKRVFARTKAGRFYRDALEEKENRWTYSWSLCMYGTQAMADEAGLDVKTYRQQIIEACYLDASDPVAERRNIWKKLSQAKDYLNNLDIEYIHVIWEDVDLTVKLWEKRQRLWATGQNMPSFELYCSPDRRWTNWRIRFNQPLYRHWVLIEWIELHFKEWVVTRASAKKNEANLLEMIAQENADKVGEFSFTDKRFSRITRFMWETLFDENVWWKYWNTHIALWNAYKDWYAGDVKSLTKEDWKKLWFNESVIHTDIISTSDRIVTATMKSGRQEILYKDGMYTFLQA